VPDPLLSARSISRKFGYRVVLEDVSFDVRAGEALVVRGANGSGKTTLLRILAGLLRPTTGTVLRAGGLGYLAHHSMLYDALTARENLRFVARLHGLAPAGTSDSLIERLGLDGRADDPVSTYSRGMIQRLALARALLIDPQVLLLDEPLSHLDEPGSRVVLEILGEQRRRGRALVVVSHQRAELETLGAASIALANGRLVSGAAADPYG